MGRSQSKTETMDLNANTCLASETSIAFSAAQLSWDFSRTGTTDQTASKLQAQMGMTDTPPHETEMSFRMACMTAEDLGPTEAMDQSARKIQLICPTGLYHVLVVIASVPIGLHPRRRDIVPGHL